jgi:hypothetical protein
MYHDDDYHDDPVLTRIPLSQMLSAMDSFAQELG